MFPITKAIILSAVVVYVLPAPACVLLTTYATYELIKQKKI